MARLKSACRTSALEENCAWSDPRENLAAARRYMKAIESGARGDEIAQFFAPGRGRGNLSAPLLSGTAAPMTWLEYAPPPTAVIKAITRQKYEIKEEGFPRHFATKFRARGGRGELLELPGCDRGCGTLKELTPITSHSIALVGATLHLPGQASIR